MLSGLNLVRDIEVRQRSVPILYLFLELSYLHSLKDVPEAILRNASNPRRCRKAEAVLPELPHRTVYDIIFTTVGSRK